MKKEDNSVKYYRDLLGILFTSPDCEQDQYYHGFSFEKEILEKMIESEVPIQNRKFYSIKKIKILNYIHNPLNKKEFIYYENEIYNDSLPMYGYNNVNLKKYKCEQVILITNIITDNMRSNGISFSQIKIDTFYEESIVNAF